ncbi:hypothetical protein ACTOB_003804 [Actinoplanes oblitus]|uniref:Uncharacterized protein n=1 Tax=Actinoplanes oblitus TaxID=3040509 RepID=A0ABY8WQI3_9ACTN|nr:hypothetical protein [Actinoplanes oblitus]WIN00120.1 hypothetical protein ACTOB_003804 [Actinoplanes oblitus]
MDAEWLVQLASSGATTLVTAAATDLWKDLRPAFTRLLGRGDPQREIEAGQQLDALAATVEQVPEEQQDVVRREQAQQWQTQLADLLHEHPQAAEALERIVAEQRTQSGGQSVTGSSVGGAVSQIRGVRGSVRFGPDLTPGGPQLPAVPEPAPAAAPAADDTAVGEGQQVTRSWVAGPVRQVEQVDGDVDVDR